MKKSEEKEIIIIDGQEYELVETIPGIGFKSKEEEEEFIEDYVRCLEKQSREIFEIYDVEVSGRYKS